jgi:hypothetical protein
MRKIVLLLTILTFVLKSNAQTLESNFLGDDFLQYKGVYFTIKDDKKSGLSCMMYDSLIYLQKPYDKNVIYPESKNSPYSNYDSLQGRTFVVDNIVDKAGADWTVEKKGNVFDKPIMMLRDTITNQVIYYSYDASSSYNFIFNTSKIVFDQKFACSKIERKIDDFTKEININSPITSRYSISPMIIYKDIIKGNAVYRLNLTTTGSTINVNETGVIILFDDGTKWTKQSKINVSAGSYGYQYTSYITLNANDLITFSTKKIKKFRLYIYDQEVSSNDGDMFKMYVKCVKETK